MYTISLHFSVAGAQCHCLDNVHGDYCQYKTEIKTKTKTANNISNAEYRQFDREKLAAITGLGSSSAYYHPPDQRSHSFVLLMGDHSKFVFCLANPCENGGTCFVTNTATTKVR